jgi:Family of unknown function (DUF6220)
MNAARNVYRYLIVVLAADIIVQFFLAGAGVFRAEGGKARHSNAFDAHRANGSLIQALALLLLISAIAARHGRWKAALALFVLSIVQGFLAIAGWAGGLHPLGGLAILGLVGWMAHDAWRGKAQGTATVPTST